MEEESSEACSGGIVAGNDDCYDGRSGRDGRRALLLGFTEVLGLRDCRNVIKL